MPCWITQYLKYLAYLCSVVVAPFGHSSEPGLLDVFDPKPHVDAYVSKAQAEYVIPGVVVSIVFRGELVVCEGYGYSNVRTQSRVNPKTTQFQIGSIGKTMTAIAVMQQIESGRLELDRDVNQYLPFEIPNTIEEPLTLRAILSHRTGFEDSPFKGFMYRDATKVPDMEAYLASHIPRRVFPPGEVSTYSNYGVALAGYMVQRVTGVPFAEYAENRIFHPLGMRSTTYREPLENGGPMDLVPGPDTDIAVGHHKGANDKPFAEPYIFLSHIAPVGSVISTGEDMARYMMALLQGYELDGHSLLSPESAITERLYRDRLGATDIAHLMFDGRYGGHKIRTHSGGSTNIKSNMALYPELDLGVFVWVNADDGGSLTADTLHKSIVDTFFINQSKQTSHLEPSLDTSLERYTGRYQTTNRSYSRVDKLAQAGEGIVELDSDGRLRVTRNGTTGVFVEIEDGVLQRVAGELLDGVKLPIERLYAETDARGEVVSLSIPVADIHKISFFESRGFLVYTSLAAFVVAMSNLGLWFWRRRSQVCLSRLNKAAVRLSYALSVAVLVAVGLLARLLVESITPTDLIVNWPGRFEPVLYATTLIAAIGVVCIPLLVWQVITSRQLAFSIRMHDALFCVVFVVTIWALNLWHLIGLNY